jgi:2-dehydropantoate 2-reductase
MHVAVVGAGAIGSALGADLDTVTDVTVIGHESTHLERLRTGPLRFLEPDGSTTTRTLSVTTDHGAVASADLIVLAVKSYDTAGAMADLEAHLDGADVLTVQNGLGNIETIRESVAPESVVGGTTTAGATLVEPGTVSLSNRGQTRIGRPWGDSKAAVTAIADTLRSAGYKTEVVEDVQRAIWEKVLVNVGINPVAALGRVKNGALRSGPGREVMKSAIEEAVAVARAEGYKVDAVVERALDVAEATAENRSSMLRDLENGSKTEIGALNGAIVDRAEAHGLDTPINETLSAAVQLATGERTE